MFDAEEPAETWPFFVVSLKLRMGGGTVDRRDCWQLLRSATRRWSWRWAGKAGRSFLIFLSHMSCMTLKSFGSLYIGYLMVC